MKFSVNSADPFELSQEMVKLPLGDLPLHDVILHSGAAGLLLKEIRSPFTGDIYTPLKFSMSKVKFDSDSMIVLKLIKLLYFTRLVELEEAEPNLRH